MKIKNIYLIIFLDLLLWIIVVSENSDFLFFLSKFSIPISQPTEEPTIIEIKTWYVSVRVLAETTVLIPSLIIILLPNG